MNAATIVNEFFVVSGLTLGAVVGAMIFMHWRLEHNYVPRHLRWPKPGKRRWWRKR